MRKLAAIMIGASTFGSSVAAADPPAKRMAEASRSLLANAYVCEKVLGVPVPLTFSMARTLVENEMIASGMPSDDVLIAVDNLVGKIEEQGKKMPKGGTSGIATPDDNEQACQRILDGELSALRVAAARVRKAMKRK